VAAYVRPAWGPRAALGCAGAIILLGFGAWRYARDRDPRPLLGRWTRPGWSLIFSADGAVRWVGTASGRPHNETRRWRRRGGEIFVGVSSHAYFYWQRATWSLSQDRQQLRLTWYREPNGIVAEANVEDWRRDQLH
jgi:hypothetical protein